MVKRHDVNGAVLMIGEAIISIVVGLAGIRISYYGEFGSAAVLFVLVLFVASSVAVGETSRAARDPREARR